ncbi:hypothetical protein ACFY1P_19855 [Streptomyces sp. NPDC001407]|uniref:hypothetical protein n=1 Tax=Streptomyces sp. NPDC001407 TaxID=3364573 RepID=UPI003690A0DE
MTTAAEQTVDDIWHNLELKLAPTFAVLEWGEEEIQAAQQRHQETGRGPIWRAFPLIKPTHGRLHTSERLYRTHAAEVLDRVAEGRNTQPATAAEMISVLMESSLPAPLNSAAAHLYMHLFAQAFPEDFHQLIASPTDLDAYERVYGAKADEYESDLRRKLTQTWRTPKA